MTKRKNNPGCCPICGSQCVIGELHEAEWCNGTQEWKCRSCGATGEEVWEVNFTGEHIYVRDREGNSIDLESKPNASGMRYEQRSTLGMTLYSGLKPFLKIVNNGCTVETQDTALIRQLQVNEQDRSAPVIDWHLFKPGRTVLFDCTGRQFACTMNNDGKWIQLVQIVDSGEHSSSEGKLAVEMARSIVELFEDLLEEHQIIVPDEDRPADNDTPLYGCTYENLVDDVAENIVSSVNAVFDKWNDQLIDIVNEREGVADDSDRAEALDNEYCRISSKVGALRTVLDLLNN